MPRRRRQRQRSNYDDQSAPRRGRKSAAEAQVERFTWFLMVLVFAVLYLVDVSQIPNWSIPFSGAVILLGSGFYQFKHRWHVSPFTWIAGTILLMMAGVSYQSDMDFYGFTLLSFAVVIGVGVVTGET